MTNRKRAALATMSLAAAALAARGVAAASVDMRLDPPPQVLELCQVVEVDLVVASDGAAAQGFDALDAIISWDPEVLELLGKDDSGAGAFFFFSGFPPDQDGINDDLTDGDALYTALGPPGNPVMAPAAPGGLVVTTFQFRLIAAAPSTEVSYIANLGQFGHTRVLLEGANITGDTSDVADFLIGSCDGDLNLDGTVAFADLLILLGAWGPCAPCCPADYDHSGDVGFADLLVLLGNWGGC